MRKIIVAGGRGFQDYEFLKSVLDVAIDGDRVEIVSGGARGADTLGELYAKEHDQELKIFKADWKKYKNAAGPIRNESMAEYADELCAFWDGRSTGTKHMIKYARQLGLEVRLFVYDKV